MAELEDAEVEHAALEHAELLLDIAGRAIVEGLRGLRPHQPDITQLPVELSRPVGSFVTLECDAELRGCIGSIMTNEPLAADVARHAWSAAFADPRFAPLQRHEYEHLDIKISILSQLHPVQAATRAELLDRLRPGLDGLLIAAGSKRAVFLPAVWDKVSSADMFVDLLFRKAGLDPISWPRTIAAQRFTAVEVGRPVPRC